MFTLGIVSGVLLTGILLARVRIRRNERPNITRLMSNR
jgi:hypothetical protein